MAKKLTDIINDIVDALIALIKKPKSLALVISIIIVAVRLNIHLEIKTPGKVVSVISRGITTRTEEKIMFHFAISMTDLDTWIPKFGEE